MIYYLQYIASWREGKICVNYIEEIEDTAEITRTSEAARANQSSDKLLRLIELLAEQPTPLRLQEIASLADMNPSTTLRFLTALQRRNYAAQEIDTGRYYLTFKLCALASSITGYNSIRSIALSFLRSVSARFGESCNLTIESDMQVMYVEAVNSKNRMLLTTQRIGNIAPLHCTGAGKLFLSEYTAEQLDELLAVKGLQQFTDTTITAPGPLADELALIRGRGYAIDNEECEAGVRCVAAPVRDFTGRIHAAISVSGPSVRMTDAFIQENLLFLLDAARDISIRMGYAAG